MSNHRKKSLDSNFQSGRANYARAKRTPNTRRVNYKNNAQALSIVVLRMNEVNYHYRRVNFYGDELVNSWKLLFQEIIEKGILSKLNKARLREVFDKILYDIEYLIKDLQYYYFNTDDSRRQKILSAKHILLNNIYFA